MKGFKICINCGLKFKNRFGRTCTSTCAHTWLKRKHEKKDKLESNDKSEPDIIGDTDKN